MRERSTAKLGSRHDVLNSHLLSTHADRQCMDISVTVCMFLCVCVWGGGCSSPTLRPWPRRWINHEVCYAWPVWHQAHGYLPSCSTSPPFGWYQFIPLGERHIAVTVRELNSQPSSRKSNVLTTMYYWSTLKYGLQSKKRFQNIWDKMLRTYA